MDYNNDGKFDILAGDTKGQVWLFLNIGTKEKPKLAEAVRVEAAGKPIQGGQKIYKEVNGNMEVDREIPGSHELAEIYSKLHMADWDGDGLKDLLIGHNSTIVFYKNVGSASKPRFKEPSKITVPGTWPSRPSPYIVDWDDDGKLDLLVGSESSDVFFFRNTGTVTQPQLARGEKLPLDGPDYKKGYRSRIAVTDWDEDGMLDVLVGNFYSHVEDNMAGNIWLFYGK